MPITWQEVLNKITLLKNNTATGADNISVELLKSKKKEICKPLAYLFNLFLEQNYIPPEFKHSVITPIYKNSGDTSDPNNYRPISVISNIAKLFEKCIYTRLYNYLTNRNILSNNQFGFREGKNTENAILKLVSKIKNSTTNKLVIFFDLKKAFDTVNHSLLLDKLESMGIRGIVLELIKNYLTNRTCCTKLGKKLSKILQVKCGVPQGSCLGPLLFNIYINSITNLDLNGELVLFADDTALVQESNDISDLYNKANIDVLKIKNWLMENKLSLNISKTEYIDFSRDTNPSNSIILHEYHCNNTISCLCSPIKSVTSYKYLGCIVDKYLNWNLQIDAVLNTIQKTHRALFVCTDESFKKSVYSALVQSYLQYAILIWGEGNTDKLNQFVNYVIARFNLEQIPTLDELCKHKSYS